MRFWCVSAFMKSTELVPIAQMADEAGYHGMMLSDHIFYPRELKSPYPYSPYEDGRPIWDPETSWPDTWVTIGAMIGATERLHFSNNVYIAPCRPILSVAKQVSTAAVISGNRVALGMAAGWMREEFEQMGQDFADRGPRTSEMIEALRELWKPGWVEFHGEFYDIPPIMMEPAPDEPIPIYTGGHSGPALRRAARHADGWVGNAYDWDILAGIVARLRGLLAEEGRADDPFEIITGFYEPPSLDLYRRASEELGVTGLYALPWAGLEAVSTDNRAGLLENASSYHDAVNRFAEEFVHPLAEA
ncbi:MAG: TIGR03619 family F420-dependent LLM class oxidoreductase [bacterium]|nr:TIGR03619 family F420-dependent LLM class oxidoreductase [bacterium]